MPRPARSVLAVVLVGVAMLAGCSYDSGSLAGPGSTAPAPRRTTTTADPGPVVGTLPPITQPGQTAPPPLTAAPDTAPADTTVPDPLPLAGPAATTAKAHKAPSATVATSTTTASTRVLAGRPATATTTSTTVAGPQVLGVQAGAYRDRASAAQGLAQLTAKGFAGFTVSGQGPYRLVRVPLSKAAAAKLVTQLTAAGWPALTFTRPA